MEHTSKITTVLFDLDGTLLPMDQEVFIKEYFSRLVKKMMPYGYEPEALMKHIWGGTTAMVENQSGRLNEEVFWEYFTNAYGEESFQHKAIFEEFYRVDFQKVQSVCGHAPEAKEAVLFCRENGLNTILATNPLFPSIATHSRMRWAGLTPSDFSYITTYENCTHCKPNPAYYQDILALHSLTPQECLMVGNDVSEDMIAETLGINVFLLTDCLINAKNDDISGYPQGSFSDLIRYIRENMQA